MKKFIPDVWVKGNPYSPDEMRSLAENKPEEFLREISERTSKGVLRWADFRNISAHYNALADKKVPVETISGGKTKAIMASAFPILSGQLTVAGINEAMASYPSIGDQLVTEMSSVNTIDTIAEIESYDTQVDTVAEGKDFPEIGAGATSYEIRSKRNGRRLSITKEMIEKNDIPNIVNRVNALAEIASDFTEEQTLRRICDVDGSASSPAEPYVLHIGTTGTQLYNATANYPTAKNPSGTRINNNALQDSSSLDAARLVLSNMRNSRNKRVNIPVSQCTLLVPNALLSTATKILGSELEPGVENELNNWGPRGMWRPKLLSSPKLDDISTTAWYFGVFQKQFYRKWALNFEYVTLGEETETYLRSRIAFQARIAWDMEVGATNTIYVVQNLAGTTAPTA